MNGTKVVVDQSRPHTLYAAMDAIKAAAKVGNVLEVTIKRKRKIRSNEQNARLWALYTEIQGHILLMKGELVPTEDIHDHYKRRILGCRVNALGDEVPRSTVTDTLTHSEYQGHVERLAAEELGMEWH